MIVQLAPAMRVTAAGFEPRIAWRGFLTTSGMAEPGHSQDLRPFLGGNLIEKQRNDLW